MVQLTLSSTPRPSRFAGGDPSKTSGAVVVLRDRRAVVQSAVIWQKLRRKSGDVFRLRLYRANDHEPRLATFHEEEVPLRASALGERLSRLLSMDLHTEEGEPCAAIAVEDVFVGRDPHGAVRLARASGAIFGPLEERCGQPAWQAVSSSWRARCFPRGWANLDRAGLKALSLKTLPLLCPGLDLALDVLGGHDHITDAAGVAYWLRAQPWGR